MSTEKIGALIMMLAVKTGAFNFCLFRVFRLGLKFESRHPC